MHTKTHKKIVTQGDVDYANSKWDEGGYNSRVGVDCELIEHGWITDKLVEPTSNWRSDFLDEDRLTDNKEVVKNFNFSDWKLDQFIQSIIMGELTHFNFYRTNLVKFKNRKVLKVGDEFEYTNLGYMSARAVLERRSRSYQSPGDWYVPIYSIIKDLQPLKFLI